MDELTFGLSGNAGNSTVLSKTPNPANGYTTLNNGFQFSQGMPAPATSQFGVNTQGVQQTLVGTLTIAAGDTSVQGNAVAGYAQTNAAGPSAVGVFGQGATTVANANIFGGNFIAQNFAGNAAVGVDVGYIAAAEFDLNLWKLASGADPSADGENAYGIIVSGGSNMARSYGTGVGINPLVSTTNASRLTQWNYGFRTLPGAAVAAFAAGPAAASNGQNSQPILFQSISPQGNPNIASILSDLNGVLNLIPAPGQGVNIQDGHGHVLIQTSPASGGSQVVLPALTAAGVVTTSSTGVLSSSVGQLPGAATDEEAASGNIGEYLFAGGGNSIGPGPNTVTITIASPAVVSYALHGFSKTGTSPVVFTTTGALPRGIVAGTACWTVPGTATSTTFQIASSVENALAGTSIATTGTQSGTHTGAELIPLTTTVNQNFGAIKLTAGDWDVGGSVGFSLGSTTRVAYWAASLTTASATLDQKPGRYFGNQFSDAGVVLGSGISSQFAMPTRRIVVPAGSTQIVYGVLQASFTAGPAYGFGSLWARRAR